jgi:glycosyltransferase involved in cell wall biosynthesis
MHLPRRVTIDLTPMLPGGANGGAKLLALALVTEMATLASETQFILLTSVPCHAELAAVETRNVRRQLVDVDAVPLDHSEPALARARMAARLVVDTLLPASARSHIKDVAWWMLKQHRREQTARAMKSETDLHFCPFTAPFFLEADVPLVSLVHDLQFLDYPEFFTPEQQQERRQHFRDACEAADRVVCVSEFVRRSILRHSSRRPESVTTIHTGVLHGIPSQSVLVNVNDLLETNNVRSHRYLLYPANAWPHKNHQKLLEGFAGFLHGHPDSDLSLVCTGAPDPMFDKLTQQAELILPPGRFAFAGFVSDGEYEALLRNCRALIFPSLYEGFGMPLVEAMACGRPVLCSDATSLPEVAGDAALLFDPSDSAAIGGAIERLESNPELERTLIDRGRQRVRVFGSARDMASRYLAVFDDVVAARQSAQRFRASQ